MKLTYSIALCWLVVLAGCAVTPQQHYQHPSELQHWKLQGKLAVVLPGKAQSAYFTWDNHDGDYAIRVNGPLGQGSAQLAKSAQGVTLLFDGEQYQAPTGEQLMAEHLGWSFPVTNMSWWIKGLPAPGAEAEQRFDDQGRLAEIEQQGWTLRYLRYQTTAGLELPYKIVAQQAHIKLTLLLKKWRLE